MKNSPGDGYGHVIQTGEESLLKGITEEQALILLKSDFQNKAENYINDWAKSNDIVFTQQQFLLIGNLMERTF